MADKGDLIEVVVGEWEGLMRTWFEPGDPADESPTHGRIRRVGDSRLGYGSSHFEVQLMPMETVVQRVVPWTASVVIKDQRIRYADERERAGWRIAGNGVDHSTSPNGRPVEFQWVMGGEGEHDLARWLQLMRRAGWTGAVCYEIGVQCQARPDFDGPAAAERTYRWMAEACEQAGISTD